MDNVNDFIIRYYERDMEVLAIAGAYKDRLRAHIAAVQEFGRKIRVPERQLEIHDKSKWSDNEFAHYALHFCSDLSKEKTIADFVEGWLHHIHHNPHHWQYWVFPDGYSPPRSGLENGVMEMRPEYALEMIADWHGASRVYTGSWDIQKWLWENMPKIRVHTRTAEYLRNQLDGLGYADVVFMQQFAHEIELDKSV